ncbi:MAG TPA: PilZ domain-containing protein [Burkholderiales bacterium]|nr:PilZ domain-containing protein [Burkholderiales bacterium]
MGNDRRQFSGLAHRASAVLICLPQLYEVALIDISARGALVETRGKVEIKPGDRARLRVLTEKGNQAFEAEVLIVHCSELGIGLEIEAIDHHASCGLQRLIGTNSGGADLTARTLPELIEANFCANTAPAVARARPGGASRRASALAPAIAID